MIVFCVLAFLLVISKKAALEDFPRYECGRLDTFKMCYVFRLVNIVTRKCFKQKIMSINKRLHADTLHTNTRTIKTPSCEEKTRQILM